MFKRVTKKIIAMLLVIFMLCSLLQSLDVGVKYVYADTLIGGSLTNMKEIPYSPHDIRLFTVGSDPATEHAFFKFTADFGGPCTITLSDVNNFEYVIANDADFITGPDSGNPLSGATNNLNCTFNVVQGNTYYLMLYSTVADAVVPITISALNANPAKAITAFNFTGLSVTGTVNEASKTIALTVPYGTDVTALVPTIIHTGASVSPNTGVAQNFTNPVEYTVTAADGSTQKYTVTLTEEPIQGGTSINNATLITKTNTPISITGDGSNPINAYFKFVAATNGPFTITTSPASTDTEAILFYDINEVTGVRANGDTTNLEFSLLDNLNEGQIYYLKIWVYANGNAEVTLNITGDLMASPTKAITAFNFNGLTPNVIGTVNEASKTIALTVPYGTDVTALVPTIAHTGASISPNTGGAQNFTNPVEYKVTAADSSTQKYTVTVTKIANPAKAIVGVTVPVTGAVPTATIADTTEYTATISWSPADATFKGSTVYTATITVTPKTGYTLTGVPANFFTVAGATATNAADSGIVTAVFPKTDPAPISIATITGVTAPATGAAPTSTIADTTEYTATISWMPADAPFKGETVYTAIITITPKAGYTLTGVPPNFFTVAGATATNAADSGVVTAVFPATAPATCTVTFHVNGGSAVAAISNVTSGSTITAPTAPTKTGYTFAGWYKEPACTNEWDFASDVVTADITLYVKWTAETPAPSSGGGGYIPPAPVTHIDNGGSTTGSNLDQLVSGGKTLTVDGDKGAKLVFDTEALKGISGQTSGDIKVEMKDVSTEHQENLPSKLVFSLTVSSGSSTVSNFGGAVTVSLPYELKEGERAQNVTVWHLASDGTMTEIPCTYDPVTKLATFKVTHFSLYVVGVTDTALWVNPFTDVAESDWFYGAVEFAKRNGLFAGTGASTFSPNSPMTRAMLWTVLGRLDGQSLSGSSVFDAARIWAMGAGITDGTNPDGSITREQMVTILWRYAGSPKAGGDLSKFSNAGSVANYAADAMAWAVENGIIAGANGALMPQDNATRAQVAAVLQRFIKEAAK